MKKVLMLFAFLAFLSMQMFAQRTITGTVTGADDGMGLPGVSVAVKGTSLGTVTDINGKYSLEVPAEAKLLVFSFMGMKAQEVQIAGDVVNAALESEDQVIDDVVVTALGITKKEKAIGYAVQQVDGSNLTQAGESNMVASLAGRVAGVQMIGAPGAAVGGSAKIRIRGVTGLTGADPLYVIDGTPIANSNFSDEKSGYDFGNLATDINGDDIDKITVLKGPSATALYGERAKNGVILITTKTGKKKSGIGIDFSTSFTWDKAYILPEYQNQYGGGYSDQFLTTVDGVDGQTYNVLNYSADESWGPKMDGTMYRPWWSWFDDENYGTEIPMQANPDNVRDFFDTGLSNINSISFNGGSDKVSYRVGYTNLNQTGIMPNSSFKRNGINLNLSSRLTDKLTLSTNLNFTANEGKGRPAFGYSPAQGSVLQSFNQWFQRQLDMDKLRDYRNEDGTMRSWNMRSPTDPRPLYWDSPFFTVNENFETDARTRYYGNIKLAYQFTDNFKVSGTVRRDNYTQRIEQRIATGGLEQDFYSEFVATGQEDNYELFASYNNQWGDLSLQAHAGGNLRKNSYHENLGETVGGLNSAYLYNLSASVDRPNLTSRIAEKEVRSVFASADFGYKDFLFLGLTVRNDWSSSLPKDNNSYLYPSVNLGFVFSELISSNILSFGKFRASIAQVASDVDAYKTNTTFSRTTPYGSTPGFSLPDLLPNENLVPAITTSWETGLDLRFLQDRIGLDFSYYNNVSKDEILQIQVSGASGFREALINAGEIVSKGWEASLNIVPVKGEFTWDTRFNIAQNTTTVEELYGDLTNYQLDEGIGGQRWGGFTFNAAVGEEWGLMRGNGFTYIDGQKVITPGGSYVTESNKDLGSALPKFTGGFTNSFSYKNFTLMAHIDFQAGGQFFSVTKMFNNYSGLGIESAVTNDLGHNVRDDVADGGGIRVDGVLEDGTPTTVYVPAATYYGGTFGLHEMFTYDASFIKFRELAIAYNLPSNFVTKTPFNSISISLIAKNLWLMYSKVDGIDPSEILPGRNNLVFEERGQLPGTRSFGFKLAIGL